MNHVSDRMLEAYADRGPQGNVDETWAVETHLESCAPCRGRLAQRVDPDTVALIARVRAGLDAAVPRSPRMPARRRRSATWWVAPALLPRLGMTVLVVLVALGLDLVGRSDPGGFGSLVLLVAPVAPLLGVAAAWSRGLDPAHELVTASPRAGLHLVLRRTLAVLAVIIPTLTVAGWVVGASPARWLLPCLAFTVGALALGEVVGLHRAATGLALLWTVAVATPSVVTAHPPGLLEPRTLPAWATLTAVVAAVVALRRHAYTGLHSGR